RALLLCTSPFSLAPLLVGLGGLVGGVTSAATQAARVRAGETSAACAAFTASAAAARAAAGSGMLTALGSLVRSAARAGRLPAVFGGGDLPFATARAAYTVAEAGLDLARGRIDTGEFAALSCEATLTTALTWACGAVAQTVVPVPVVGALLGGLVGQAAAALVVQGLQAALVAARADGAEDAATDLLERELRTASVTSGLLGSATGHLDDRRVTHAAAVILPRLSRVQEELATSDPAGALPALAEPTGTVGGRPVFATQAEFDRWMADEDTVLRLDPNW
ncbi:hypothetical protein, partial [Streptomyces eurythermus]